MGQTTATRIARMLKVTRWRVARVGVRREYGVHIVRKIGHLLARSGHFPSPRPDPNHNLDPINPKRSLIFNAVALH